MPQYSYDRSQPRKPFEEPGEYVCTVEEFEFAFAQSSGNELLKLKLRTSGGALVYDNLVFTAKSKWKIDDCLACFLPSKGKRPPAEHENFDMNHDWANDNLLGATGLVFLSKGTTPNGKVRNEVQAYMPPKKSGQPAQGTTNPAPAAAPTSATAKPAPKAKAKPAPPDDDDSIPFN